jgi:urate oxidase
LAGICFDFQGDWPSQTPVFIQNCQDESRPHVVPPANRYSMKLQHQQYGKAHVRVLKVFRSAKQHDIKEVDVAVILEGDFASSYTKGDNSKLVATDTMKNTVNALSKRHLGREIEKFGLALGEHFLKHYPQIKTATIHLTERLWQRIPVNGRPHRHSFTGSVQEKPFARVVCSRDHSIVESGIQDLVILKTTESGFEGYPRCEFTTLPETKDRIMATNMTGSWVYAKTPKSFTRSNEKILTAMLKVFATTYSPSVQTTLYQMAEAALRIAPEISQVTLKMPNKHCLLINLSPFGLENKNEIFVPTDEPHGQIEATITRT